MAEAVESVDTRAKYSDEILGTLGEFSNSRLPTELDVLKYYLYIIKKEKIPIRDQRKIVIGKIVEKLILIWTKSSIPFVSETRISQKINQLVERHKNVLKNKNKPSVMRRINEFNNSLNVLFDLACCKCVIIDECTCEKKNKVPKLEVSFLKDQRSQRLMVIGSLDKETTKKNLLRIEKKEKMDKKLEALEHVNSEPESSRKKRERSLSNKIDMQTPGPSGENLQPQCRMDLRTAAMACDRFLVSDRVGAGIISAAFESCGLIDEENQKDVVDRFKIRRERKKNRNEIIKKRQDISLKSIFFDGRRDETIYNLAYEGKFYPRKKLEEHIVILEEPFSKFIGHVAVDHGTSENIVMSMNNFFEQNDIVTNSVDALGCDGTNVNVGKNNGVIVRFEKLLNKPLQWCICLLHGIELLLRHIFEALDGRTSGPRSYTGDIGKLLITCETKPIVNFDKIPSDKYISLHNTDLSRDQQYLLDMCKAVTSGEISVNLSKKKPGPLCHARWITTASRILRLYVSAEKPMENLKILTHFVINVYALCWFDIKFNPSIINGSRHLFYMIRKSRYFQGDLKTVIEQVIQRNGFYANQENILLSMAFDDDKTIRSLAYKRILKARQTLRSGIRQFEVPRINFNATVYYEMINWQEVQRTDPPLLRVHSDEEINNALQEGSFLSGEYTEIPCHTQSVENAIKLITEASTKVCGSEERDKFTLVRLESRSLRPKFETKKDYFSKE